MPERTLYFDESGYTGFDLLNRDQPIFCVASSQIDNAQAAEILRTSFPNYKGAEFKFRNIWGRDTNRSGLIRFAKYLGALSESVFVYSIDKRFCVLTKLVDFLIEPMAHDAGIDFYAERYAPKLCNMFKFALDRFGDPQLFESLVNAYQRFARAPTQASLRDLQTILTIMAHSVPEEVATFIGMAELGSKLFERFHDVNDHRSSSELHVTTLLASVSYWRGRTSDDLAVVHDQSSNFFRRADIWSALTGRDAPEGIHPMPDGSEVQFPLRVVSTTACDSRQSHGVQLCDVLAGLVARLKRPGHDEDEAAFLQRVLDAGLGNVSGDGIGQAFDFLDQEPRLLDGPDVIDRIAEVIRAGKTGRA